MKIGKIENKHVFLQGFDSPESKTIKKDFNILWKRQLSVTFDNVYAFMAQKLTNYYKSIDLGTKKAVEQTS